MRTRQDTRSFDLKLLEEIHQLFEPARVDGFKKGTFVYAIRWRYDIAAERVLSEDSKEMPTRRVFFMMEIDQNIAIICLGLLHS